MRKRYLDDDAFDFGVAAIVGTSLLSGWSFHEIVAELAPKMPKREDDGWTQAWVSAAENLQMIVNRSFDGNDRILFLRHLGHWIRNYDRLSGKRKFKILRGAWFNYRKTPNPERVSDCTSCVLAFLMRFSMGTAPLDPKVPIPSRAKLDGQARTPQ